MSYPARAERLGKYDGKMWYKVNFNAVNDWFEFTDWV